MSSSEQVSHLMLRNKLQVGIYAYSLTNVPFECIGLPSSKFFLFLQEMYLCQNGKMLLLYGKNVYE